MSDGNVPDVDYMPIVKKGTTFSSLNGNGFSLTEDVNFGDPNNEIVVANVNNTTGAPISYAVKAAGKVVSGVVESEDITIGNFQKFLRLELSAPNISEIVSIVDSSGNEYYEVDYLSQDVVYRATTSTQNNNTSHSSKLKTICGS